MTDPDRLSRRSSGLAAELLRAAAEEQPNDVGMRQTLLALGVSGVLLSSTSAGAVVGAKLMSAGVGAASAGAGAAGVGAAGVGLTNAGSISTLSAAVVIKWLGMGLVGGLGLAGVAAVATEPSAPSARPGVVSRATEAPPQAKQAAVAPRKSELQQVVAKEPAPELAVSATAPAPHPVVGPVEPPAARPALDVGIPLAAEVAYVDHARALLGAGQSSEGLALLDHYAQQFREARLLPEVLFLQLEAYERAGRSTEARSAAQRLVLGFPNSPHAGRARKLLGQ
jgi:hypothetical protein